MEANDLEQIKKEVDVGGEIDTDFIIKTLSRYSINDLYLFRDCIDFMLLYNK